ncbi:hypothetical protein [uncultured Ruegeria sp.]|uniref:hypothetical protein n=1 Tax=uncultured Ruegeria sp. TaxID=259304 RepID=UPI00260C4AAC|nr:hypothetical protein [uncultured Ruegeria sp.]
MSLNQISKFLGVSAVVFTPFATAVSAQESAGESMVSRNVFATIEGLDKEQSLSTFTIEVDGKRRQLDIAALVQDVVEDKLDYRSDDFAQILVDAKDNELIGSDLGALVDAYQDGGMHAVAAEQVIAFVQGGAECVANGGVLASNRPRLIRSEMDLHFNVGPLPDGSNFGRGQFDVSSIKVLLCVVANAPENSYPIIVDRRWVFNVGDEALERLTEVEFPPNSDNIYPVNLKAKGVGIELVSYYVSGVRQPRTDILYKKSPNSCIDIFFKVAPDSDQPVMISKPGDLVFCAGGACGGKPPKLDATH